MLSVAGLGLCVGSQEFLMGVLLSWGGGWGRFIIRQPTLFHELAVVRVGGA